MRVEFPYGEERIPFDFPDGMEVEVLEPASVPRQDLGALMKRGLTHPIGSPSFDEFVKDASSLLFIVNDATRPTPTGEILNHLRDRIENKKIAFIIATGDHRAPSEDELLQIFGSHLDRLRDQVIVHDSKKKEDLARFGRTSFGTEVFFNKAILEYDKIVIITSVEPHYFAGYTGGRKSFNPGVAGFETITGNHKLALSPESSSLRLEGNPVHDDMIESVKMIKKDVFSILTVLDREHNVYAVECGDIFASMSHAVRKAEEVFCRPISAKADIVVTVAGHPSDIDLYQSQKAIDNGKLALKENGIMIMISKCRKGTGPEGFIKLMASTGSPEETMTKLGEGYRLGYHKAAKMCEIMMNGKIWAVTGLEPSVLESIFIKPCATVDCAINDALREKGEGARVCVLLDGSLVVPKVSQRV